jgi:hypothetical protein
MFEDSQKQHRQFAFHKKDNLQSIYMNECVCVPACACTQARNNRTVQHSSDCKTLSCLPVGTLLSASATFLHGLIHDPVKWGQYVPLRCQALFQLHSITTNKAMNFIAATMKISNVLVSVVFKPLIIQPV